MAREWSDDEAKKGNDLSAAVLDLLKEESDPEFCLAVLTNSMAHIIFHSNPDGEARNRVAGHLLDRLSECLDRLDQYWRSN